MSRNFFGAPHPPGSPDDDRPAPVAGCSGRLPLPGRAQAALLAALVGALVVFTVKPTLHPEAAPKWAAPTGHSRRVEALAFAPDGRWLATGENDLEAGGNDGTVVVWEVGRG